MRTFKITCAATRILYRASGSNLSDLRSNSLPIRHFLQPREVCAVTNVSKSIYGHENHEKDLDTNDKTKKKWCHRTRTPWPHSMKSNIIDSSPRFALHHTDWLENASHIYLLISSLSIYEHDEEATSIYVMVKST